jgi:glyoxylase-like metal-dependent hydrolase (beta-lactamase superfamily II)
MEYILKISKQVLIFFGVLGFITHSAWATNASFDFAVTPIADNVYSIVSPAYGRPTPENKGWNSNSHFVVTEEGVLVFDTGSSELIGQGIISAIKSVTNKPVRWVVNSHSHADHWLGNAAFVDIGAEIISTEPSVATMKKDGPIDVGAFSRMTKGATGSPRLSYPTLLLAQGEKRNLGGVDVEFIFSNGAHSPGDILMWLPKQKIIFGGDVLSSDWMPIITHHGNMPNLIDTLHAVITMNPAIVLPGHGKPTTVKSVIRDADLLNAVWALVKEGYDDGKKPDEILSQVSTELGQKYRPLYKDFDANSNYLVTQVYKISAR